MKFTVYTKVRGDARPRSNFKQKRVYEKKENKDYKKLIRESFMEANGGKPPSKKPIWLYVETFRALPKSRPKKIESEPDTFKPDIDNIDKIVQDALNGLAYEDDKQITMLMVRKHRRTRMQKEKIVVRIEEHDD